MWTGCRKGSLNCDIPFDRTGAQNWRLGYFPPSLKKRTAARRHSTHHTLNLTSAAGVVEENSSRASLEIVFFETYNS